MGLAEPIISGENADKIVEMTGRLPEIEDMNEIINLCHPVRRNK